MESLTSFFPDEESAPACNTTPLAMQDPRDATLRRYSYGVALPVICCLGILGNVLNLVVLTRRNMKGTAYIYMRGMLCTRKGSNGMPHFQILTRKVFGFERTYGSVQEKGSSFSKKQN